MMHPTQDFNDIVIRLKKPEKANHPHIQKPTGNKQIQKLENEEPEAPKKIAPDVKKKICQARTAMKMTQQELAQRINVKPDIVKDYECGNAIPNPQILNRLQKVLNIKSFK